VREGDREGVMGVSMGRAISVLGHRVSANTHTSKSALGKPKMGADLTIFE
jgi:hypothetical protein